MPRNWGPVDPVGKTGDVLQGRREKTGRLRKGVFCGLLVLCLLLDDSDKADEGEAGAEEIKS